MIKLNTPYTIENGKDQVIFIEGKNGTINGTYSDATLTGTLEGNLLKATFHNKKVNATGLMEITFHENGFDAQWKKGLEPGPMRGKWEGIIENNSTSNNTQLSDEQKQYLEEGVTLEDFDEEYQGGDDGKVAWMKDRNFVLEALRQDARILKHASTELKADRELVLEAIKHDVNAIDYADDDLRWNPDIRTARIIRYFKGNENITITDDDFKIFVVESDAYDPIEIIENFLFKVEYILLKYKKVEFEKFCKRITDFVNSNHECFWLLQLVHTVIRKCEIWDVSIHEEANEIFFRFDISFEPSIEFETYFNDSEINSSWDDCKWTISEDEEGLHFSEFIMSRTGMNWDTESWSDLKFYNHAISRIWVGIINYSLRFLNEGFDEENGAICLHSVVQEYYEPIQDSGNACYGINTFRIIAEYLLEISKNDYDLNETDRDDLEEFNGWQFDLNKVAHNMFNRDLFECAFPIATEFAKKNKR